MCNVFECFPIHVFLPSKIYASRGAWVAWCFCVSISFRAPLSDCCRRRLPCIGLQLPRSVLLPGKTNRAIMNLDLEPALNYPLPVQGMLEIPDDMAGKLTPQGQDPAHAALEAVSIEGYRSSALSAYQTRRLLRLETRYELDGFLMAHNVWEYASGLEDLGQDRQTLRQLESHGRPTR